MPLHLSNVSSALSASMVGFAGPLALPASAVSAAGARFAGIGAAFRRPAARLLAHALEHGLQALRRRKVGG